MLLSKTLQVSRLSLKSSTPQNLNLPVMVKGSLTRSGHLILEAAILGAIRQYILSRSMDVLSRGCFSMPFFRAGPDLTLRRRANFETEANGGWSKRRQRT